jgi:hypothetical protein
MFRRSVASALAAAVVAGFLLAACGDEPKPTRERAIASFCTRIPMGESSALLDGFRSDAQLFEDAGDLTTARRIHDAVAARADADTTVSVFLLDAVTPEQKDAIRRSIEVWPGVASVDEVTKEEAYQRAIEMFAGDPAILRNLSPDALPASFDVTVSVRDADSLQDSVRSMAGVEEVSGAPGGEHGSALVALAQVQGDVCPEMPDATSMLGD